MGTSICSQIDEWTYDPENYYESPAAYVKHFRENIALAQFDEDDDELDEADMTLE